jgi:hypothetical protein
MRTRQSQRDNETLIQRTSARQNFSRDGLACLILPPFAIVSSTSGIIKSGHFSDKVRHVLYIPGKAIAKQNFINSSKLA